MIPILYFRAYGCFFLWLVFTSNLLVEPEQSNYLAEGQT